ncbi:MAG: glycosyltransferase [Schleiferiaceae bacterium]
MLSILIPTFDWPLGPLVQELHHQGKQLGIPFEILASDNHGSSSHASGNQKLNDLEGVEYYIDTEHLGRSANRNQLAKKAQYEWLLFLDADAEIASDDFLAQYVASFDKADVLCGGTSYSNEVPESEYLLRYTIGKNKEERTAEERNQHPYSAFSSFNFCLKKSAFENIGFDESLTQYGHEDTLFGKSLKHNAISLLHINNPAHHVGLDDNATFIEKTKTAVESLQKLMEEGKVDEDITLYKWYQRIKKSGMVTPMSLLFDYSHALWEKKLATAPDTKVYDLYKLSYLAKLEKSQ